MFQIRHNFFRPVVAGAFFIPLGSHVAAHPSPDQDAPVSVGENGDASETVRDDTWLSIGIGAAVLPSYEGSDDAVFKAIPLVQGKLGPVYINPRPAGLALDFLPKPESGVRFSAGVSMRYPRAAAESVRSFLMLRFGLHLGLRQKNLRELLIRPRGTLPTSERQLTALKRGELRWSARDGGWEVFIPSSAFKNANSSFFRKMPFRLLLPDLAGLYQQIDAYVSVHRAALLNGADDPRTFFVKTVKTTSRDAAYDQNSFYEAWRLIIQRYGIHNPYTGQGAIKGLLPHGPHNVRDVLATHILKQTGSYEQASYAIQDTPDTVAKHYGRFLPHDKAALAAQILNRVC